MITNPLLAQVLMMVVFVLAVYFHLAKKNFSVAMMYGIQSTAIAALLVVSFLERGSLSLLVIALVTFVVKVVLAPTFFIRLVNRHKLRFTVSSYLNTPMTLVVVAVISVLANSHIFAPLTRLVPGNSTYLSLALAAMLISIFLMINRKSALSQIVGILSLENSIVAFAIFSGLEQSPILQLGVLFDISVWLVIATVFVAMLYKHFGSLDVTSVSMKHLKD
jgi:hydrogenase-4 component E